MKNLDKYLNKVNSFNENIDSIDSIYSGWEVVEGDLDLSIFPSMKYLGKLRIVRGNLYCPASIINLGNLKYVSKNLDLEDCKNLKTLNNLLHVGENLRLEFCENLKTLSNLKYVGKDLICPEELKSLGKLKEVGGNIYLSGSNITEKYVEKNYPHLLNKCKW